MLLSVLPASPRLVEAHFPALDVPAPPNIGPAAGQGAVSQTGTHVTREAALVQAVEGAPPKTGALISYIQSRYHHSHRSDLAELACLAAQVELQGSDKPHAPCSVMVLLCALNDLLSAQMQQDDRVLFPMMVSAVPPKMTGLIRQAITEHRILRDLLAELHGVAKRSAPTAAADLVWAALCFGIQEFTDELAAHLHLKEAVLFPRFL